MPAHKLGERVHHDIGAVLDRAQQHRRGHGVIHHEWDAVPVRHLRQRLDIADVAGRIAYALAVDGARLGVDERSIASGRSDSAKRTDTPCSGRICANSVCVVP